jgi:hypothetical protein
MIVLSLVCLPLAPGAGQAAEPSAPPYTFVDPDDPALAEIRQVGTRAIDDVGNALVLELRRELTTKSPAAIVPMMHLRKYKLPAATPGKPSVTAVRRTSFRVRNPANLPDPADVSALHLIEGQLEQGENVAPLVMQKIEVPDQPVEWRLYRPLVVLKECLACHGTENALAPGVAEAIGLLYPTDDARGYRAGEWRGLLRVSVTIAPPKKR